MNFARINGVLLHYRLAGPEGAPVVVLANSLGTDARIWDGVIARLAGRYRVISYDKRGHGLSDVPAGEFSLEHHLDDLFGLLEHLGVERFALGGVSIGGIIAEGAALRAPERVTALVICCSAPRMGDVAMWSARMEKVSAEGMASIADAVMERWFSPGFRAGRPQELAGWKNMFLGGSAEGYAATCATLRDTDLTEEIGAIKLPVLVVAGADDLAAPLALVQAGAERMDGARLEVLAGVGHIPSIEEPEKLAALMTDFFEEAGHG